jgi:hypothetical protein
VIVRPFREGDRLFRMGVHRHDAKEQFYEATTERIEPVRVPRRAPHRVVRQPLPKPIALPMIEESRSSAVMLFLGAAIILIAALIAVL